MRFAIVSIKTGHIATPLEYVTNPIVWPNGEALHAASVGDENDGYRLVAVEYDTAPNRFSSPGIGVEGKVDGQTLRLTRDWISQDLTQVVDELCGTVDVWASMERRKYITTGDGQEMIYLQKKAEADAFMLSGGEDYPLLKASMRDGQSIKDVAQTVIATAYLWTATAARIEKTRLDAKSAIRAAKDVDGALAAYQSVKWG